MKENDQSIPFVTINEKKDSFLIRHLTPNISPDTFYETPHRHSYQEIIYIKSGKGQHAIDGQAIPLTKNTFYIIREGQIHQFIQGKNLHGLLIRFSKDFFPSVGLDQISPYYFVSESFEPVILPMEEEMTRDYEMLFDMILKEYHQPDGTFKKRTVLQHLLSIMVYKLERYRRDLDIAQAKSTNNQEREIFLQFNQLLDREFTEKHDVRHYARALGVRPRVLSKLTRNVTGYTAKKFILNRLIIEAKRKLRFTGMTLKEITFDLGLDSPSYFSRLFKEQTGMTPREYQLSKK